MTSEKLGALVSESYGNDHSWQVYQNLLAVAEALREAWRERDEARIGWCLKLGEDARHYRNLAIVLGAKPDQMLNQFDRDLCEQGIDPTNTSGGYHISWNDEMEALRELWEENERLTKERDEARARLRMVEEQHQDWGFIHDILKADVLSLMKGRDEARGALKRVAQLIDDVRVLRATNVELPHFRVHLPEEDWDNISAAVKAALGEG